MLSPIWIASSRVGAKISARGPAQVSDDPLKIAVNLCNIGRTKAAGFTSTRLCNAQVDRGLRLDAIWIGLGLV